MSPCSWAKGRCRASLLFFPSLPCFQVLREAEGQTHSTVESQDCWDRPWHGMAWHSARTLLPCELGIIKTNLFGIWIPMVSISIRNRYSF